MTTKLCPHCHKRKDLDKFGKRKIGKKTYLQSHCIECRGVKNPNAKRVTKTRKRSQKQTKTTRRKDRKSRSRTKRPTKPSGRSRVELEAKAAKLEQMIAKLEARLPQ